MKDIFISYSSQQRELVTKVNQALEGRGFETWFDQHSIPISSEWFDEIHQGVQNCTLFLLFWSKDADKSDYVTEERNHAYSLMLSQKRPKIMVVRLDDTEVPQPLQRFQHPSIMPDASDATVQQLVNKVGELFTYKSGKPLGDNYSQAVGETGLVRVPFKYQHNGNCVAYLVGEPGRVFAKNAEELALVLQFYQTTSTPVLEQVHTTLSPSDGWMLYITGPRDPNNRHAFTIPWEQDVWQACADFVRSCIHDASVQDTILNMFLLAPTALAAGIVNRLTRYRHVRFFQNVPGNAVEPYKLVIDNPPSLT